jgi:hypothetical protein
MGPVQLMAALQQRFTHPPTEDSDVTALPSHVGVCRYGNRCLTFGFIGNYTKCQVCWPLENARRTLPLDHSLLERLQARPRATQGFNGIHNSTQQDERLTFCHRSLCLASKLVDLPCTPCALKKKFSSRWGRPVLVSPRINRLFFFPEHAVGDRYPCQILPSPTD